MGIRGLSSFFNENSEFSKPFQLHDTCVIFDGNNLIHKLYFNYKINFLYGGDYNKYADSIRRYFLKYIECNIKPILIFDGGFDVSGKKLKTMYRRQKQRLSEITHLIRHGTSSGRVLPLLSHEVFVSILNELNIAFAQCDYEADDQITAVANYYKCPVISADSDFYIFDVHAGFINIDSINLNVCVQENSEGKEYKYLSCDIYYVDNFLSYFPGVDKSILPLFGTLLGNDYVEEKEFENFFSNIQLPKYKGRKLILSTRQKKMIGLLCWLKNKSLHEATDQVLEYLKKDKREYVKSIVLRAVDSYELHYCNLCSIIDNKLYNTKIENFISERLTTPCGSALPLDFMLKFHSAQFCSFFINAVVSHRVFLKPLVEDLAFPSSFVCSRYIRQVIYGILVRHNVNGRSCTSEECYLPIEETDRQGNSFLKTLVIPVFLLKNDMTLPQLDELENFDTEKGKHILASALGVDADMFSSLPEKWQLLFGCCKYWLYNCNPHTTESFLFALIVNFIFFCLIDPGSFVDSNFECPEDNPAEKVHSCSSVVCSLSRITCSQIRFAKKNLEKYLQRPSFNSGKPLSIYIIHCYSQLQVCVLNTLTLNKLLGCYVKNPDLHKCFNGTLLYNLTKDISSRSNPSLFIAELLGRDTTLHSLFTSLYSLLCQDVPSDYIQKKPLFNAKIKKMSRKKLNSRNENIDALSWKFSDLSTVELL